MKILYLYKYVTKMYFIKEQNTTLSEVQDYYSEISNFI